MTHLSEIHVAAPKAAFVIPQTVTIGGTVYFEGPVLVEGVVDGGVRAPMVQVAKGGVVDGVVVGDHVVVIGEVTGSIYAKELVLRTDCTVEGQIYHEALVLESGCFFEGKSRRFPNAVSMAPDP